MKLYEVPRNSKMMIEFEGYEGLQPCLFHHVDGMYSYCTFGEGDDKKIFHLSVSTPMKKVGGHYEIDIPKEEENEAK